MPELSDEIPTKICSQKILSNLSVFFSDKHGSWYISSEDTHFSCSDNLSEKKVVNPCIDAPTSPDTAHRI